MKKLVEILLTSSVGVFAGNFAVGPSVALAVSGDLEHEACEVEFKEKSVVLVDAASIIKCKSDFQNIVIDHIEVVAQGDELLSNSDKIELAKARSAKVQSDLQKLYPRMTVNVRTPSDSKEYGRNAEIRAYYNGTLSKSTSTLLDSGRKPVDSRVTPSENADTSTQVASRSSDTYSDNTAASSNLQRENFPSGWNDIRLAVRAGMDKLWRQDDSYQAIGTDVSYVRRNIGTRLVRFEAGATGSFLLGDTQDLVGFNYHGTAYPALEVSSLVFGPRLLLGGSWDNRRNVTELDAGGEGRLGLESGNLSLFFSAGRTRELTRIAMDVGATF